jgi:hypothetical protein
MQVAKALVEFETLWHQAWLKGIEQQKAGLQAPLLVRHPDSGKLLVNLDRDVMQLIRWATHVYEQLTWSTHAACFTRQASQSAAQLSWQTPVPEAPLLAY